MFNALKSATIAEIDAVRVPSERPYSRGRSGSRWKPIQPAELRAEAVRAFKAPRSTWVLARRGHAIVGVLQVGDALVTIRHSNDSFWALAVFYTYSEGGVALVGNSYNAGWESPEATLRETMDHAAETWGATVSRQDALWRARAGEMLPRDEALDALFAAGRSRVVPWRYILPAWEALPRAKRVSRGQIAAALATASLVRSVDEQVESALLIRDQIIKL